MEKVIRNKKGGSRFDFLINGRILKSKRSAEWTVSKLVALILLVAVIVLVVVGLSTGSLNPLTKKLKDTFNSVLAFFGKKDVGTEQNRLPIEIVWKDGQLPMKGFFVVDDLDACDVELTDSLEKDAQQTRFRIIGGEIKYLSADKNWYGLKYQVVPDVPGLAEQREAYDSLNSFFIKHQSAVYAQFRDVGDAAKVIFEVQNPKIILKIEAHGTDRDVYVKFDSRRWYKDDKETGWTDEQAAADIYEEADDLVDDIVYYWVEMGASSHWAVIPGMRGSPGEIDDDEDFATFKTWLFGYLKTERDKAAYSKTAAEFFANEIKGDTLPFKGKEEKVGFDMAGDRRLLYFSPESKQYGITGNFGSQLCKFSEGSCKNVYDNKQVESASGDYLDYMLKVTAINNYLKEMC